MDDKQHTSSSDDERAEIATSNQDQQTNSSKRVHLKRWQFISILITVARIGKTCFRRKSRS